MSAFGTCDFVHTTLLYVSLIRKSSEWSQLSIEIDLGMRLARRSLWMSAFGTCDSCIKSLSSYRPVHPHRKINKEQSLS